MKKYIGGYSILDLASTTIYKDALGALNQNKPVLVYDDPEAYFADTIKATTIEGDVVIQITKGGKIITINDVNAVSSEGDIYVDVKPMYLHNVELKDNDNVEYHIEFISKKSTYTFDEFLNYVKTNFTSTTNCLGLNGTKASSNLLRCFVGLYYKSSNNSYIIFADTQNFNFTSGSITTSAEQFTLGSNWTFNIVSTLI